MGMRVKTKASRKTRAKLGVDALNSSGADSCSETEINSSPAAKTPNLVARLMGLDLLPDNDSISPSPSCGAKPRFDHPRKPTKNQTTRHRNSVDGSDIAGIRSLPETPRISAARRSDVDYHHRLSLQLNKENNLSINEDENRSPGLYAKQRVKQIKENVSSRKVGIDITNTVTSRGQQKGKDEVIGRQFKFNKSAREEAAAAPTPSPRLRIVEPKKYQNKSECTNFQNLQSFKDSSTLGRKIKNDPSDTAASKFDIRLRKPQQATDIIRYKQEEPFVRSPAGNRVDAYEKKCKKTPLSPHLLNISVPNLLPLVKKDPCPPETKVTQKKEPSEAQRPKPSRGSSPLSCSSCQENKEEATNVHGSQDGDRRYGCGSSAATTADESAEREYVTQLLRRTGIYDNTVVSSATWFSSSHPFDPSVFYCMEELGPAMKTTNLGRMRHLSNRKLVFDFVDVIVAELFQPIARSFGSTGPGVHLMNGTQLVEALVSKLRTFPQADCRVLEDINALAEIDLQAVKVKDSMALEEECEVIVTAVEEEIVERLIEETATEIGRPTKRFRVNSELAKWSHGRSRDHMRC